LVRSSRLASLLGEASLLETVWAPLEVLLLRAVWVFLEVLLLGEEWAPLVASAREAHSAPSSGVLAVSHPL
jgi:hypothetical protein